MFGRHQAIVESVIFWAVIALFVLSLRGLL
jgi:hypothetical protein